ncbi:hypothetical protein EVAR_48292_1 [Eumeta japonica]|uniref:Uncharacterized protein n=1 Tax=Eumeta variegata TaxID=151549 RepID=A0A4C1WMZ0_EUMVA|nr:hypothetical protein EVAR_48292_1 [Eumeta japonica]
MIAGDGWYIKNYVIARDLKVGTLEKFIKLLVRRAFSHADVGPYTSLHNLASQCDRPPKGYRLSRDLLSDSSDEVKVRADGHSPADDSRYIMTLLGHDITTGGQCPF